MSNDMMTDEGILAGAEQLANEHDCKKYHPNLDAG